MEDRLLVSETNQLPRLDEQSPRRLLKEELVVAAPGPICDQPASNIKTAEMGSMHVSSHS